MDMERWAKASVDSQQFGQMKRVKCGFRDSNGAQGRWGAGGGVAAWGHKIAFSWQNG